MKARWCTLGELSTTVTREQVLDANDLLDALEEADDVARAKAEANRKK